MNNEKQLSSTGDLLADWTNEHFPAYNTADGEIRIAWSNVIAALTVAPREQDDEWFSRVIPDVVTKCVVLINRGHIELPLILDAIRYSMSLERRPSDQFNNDELMRKIEDEINRHK